MFIHNFKYCLKILINGKVTIFWTLVFPILLGTFMYIAFGNVMETDEMFKNVDVAVICEGDGETVVTVLESLENGDEKLLNVRRMTEEEALAAVKDGEVQAAIYTSDLRMIGYNSSYKTTVIESILVQYKQNQAIFEKLAYGKDEAGLKALMEKMTSSSSFVKEKASTNGSQNELYNYFFAVFAMSCLFASFSSVFTTHNMQAYSSTLGMRRCVSPVRKSVMIVAEYAALCLIHFIVELIALLYFTLIGIDFGDKYPAIMLMLLVGCMIGLSIGVIVGSIPKLKQGGKVGIAVGIGMLLSVLADLCISGIKESIEKTAPIINRINPAALITDSFYSLNVYSDYSRYTKDMLALVIEAVILLVAGFMVIRRNYAKALA